MMWVVDELTVSIYMFISDEVDSIPYAVKHNYHTVFTLYLRYTRSKPYENTFTLIKPFCKKEVSHSTAQPPLQKKNPEPV